jgi:type I restriction enzyme, R subunit
MTPEEKAREVIDKKLGQAGWLLQDMSQFNPLASLGVAVREYPTSSGPVDYALFVGRSPVGVVEAKESKKGEALTTVEDQSMRYANSTFRWANNIRPIRFVYESTDIITRFTDYADEKARSRQVFSFHQPETLDKWLRAKDTLRNNLKRFPPFDNTGFRDCQTRAIINLEKSFSENRPRALIQMATGAGKTFTAITSAYRLLRFAKAKRLLFLVDTRNLGQQAEEEFRKYKPNDDVRLFPELYNVRRLNSSYIPEDTHICISTIQRMYSIMRGEELDESMEETSPNEVQVVGRPKEVVYNEKYPIEFFEFIIIDECHRSIYNIWQQVLDYFDAFLIGLTATPDKRTFAFFNENVVSEYSHEQAVIDNVNVGGDIYTIETDITQNGSLILKQLIEKRDRLTRKKRWEQLDEDLEYEGTQLDRDVVNPSQIRTVIRTIKEKMLSEIFPGRTEIPKTIIFAKTDSHAEDIVHIVREEFGEGNAFCKKITYQTQENPKSLLSAFRNDYYPRIAVTVDMIATGIDMKPVECLIFMRDVRSRNYFEQMKGRGTRTLAKDDLQKVTPSAITNKTHYVIIDAVGVTKSLKTDSRPLERKPTVSFRDLMMNAAMGSHDEDVLTSLANRLARLNSEMASKERKKFIEIAGGVAVNNIVKNLLDTFDSDILEQNARERFSIPLGQAVTSKQISGAQENFFRTATMPFYSPEVRDYLENVRKNHEQVIDNVNLDSVAFTGWSEQQAEKADYAISHFRKFIEENKDEITALSIIYSQSYQNRALTLDMIKELHEKLMASPYRLSSDRLWESYYIKKPGAVKGRGSVRMLTDIVSLIRFELGYNNELTPYADTVNYNFMRWTLAKNAGNIHFTDEQMNWLRMIKNHIAISISIEPDDLELTPFDDKGGLGRFYQLFGSGYLDVLREMNSALVA